MKISMGLNQQYDSPCCDVCDKSTRFPTKDETGVFQNLVGLLRETIRNDIDVTAKQFIELYRGSSATALERISLTESAREHLIVYWR